MKCRTQGTDLRWEFACPICRGAVSPDGETGQPVSGCGMRCKECGQTFSSAAGIWRFLPEERATEYGAFLGEYQIVRADEGWGASNAGYYRALPRVARDDPQRQTWRIRAKSFAALLQRVIAPREAQLRRPMRILDLGAGNCSLSHRLAEREHQVAAVDISTSTTDGLGAHEWYGPHGQFVPVQAEFDRLPFTADQIDLAVFNASLHYATDYAVTLGEAKRVLRPDGRVVIMDSPVYRDASSGVRMVHERETAYERAYGFRSNALDAEGFLTTARLEELAACVGIRWDVFEPFYGVGWLLRPWKAKLRGRREPAGLPLIVGTPVA